MAKILVAYFTRSGNTKRMAEAVVGGAKSVDNAQVTLKTIDQVQPKELVDYDGLILGSPVYYGGMAAAVKQLLDESVALHGRLRGKVGGAFATLGVLGGGTELTVMGIVQAWLIHGMVVQGNPTGGHFGAVSIGSPDDKALAEGSKIGALVANLAVKLFG